MVRVAVAGGHGDVGRTLVEVFRREQHDVIILSRTVGIVLRSLSMQTLDRHTE